MNSFEVGKVGICLFMLCGAAFGQDVRPPALERSAKPPAKLVIPLEHVPVAEVAESLQQFVHGNATIKIVPLTLSNSLLVAGVEDGDVEVMRDLVGLIDRKPPAIDIDVTIIQSTVTGDAEVKAVTLSGNAKDVASNVEALREAGTLKVLERLHVSAIDTQRAQLTVGTTQPVMRGANFAGPPGAGRSSPSFSMENFGSTLTAVARVSGDDVLIEMSVEKSWGSEAKPASEDEDTRSFRPETAHKMQIISTIRVGKDQAVHVGGMTVTTAGEQSRISAIVTAQVVP